MNRFLSLTSLRAIALGAGVLLGASAQAAPVSQWASKVLGFSSQWSSTSWSAAQTLGAPDTTNYGDIPTSWAAAQRNGGMQFLTLGFDTPVYSSGAMIRETWGNGFVTQVDALDQNGLLHTVWSGKDTSLAGSPVDFLVNWSTTAYATVGLKIYVNTEHDQAAWEEIDAVRLFGQTGAPSQVPEPATWSLVGLASLGLLARRRRSA